MRTLTLVATVLLSTSAFAEYAGELAIDMTGKVYVGAATASDAGAVDAGAPVMMAPVSIVGETIVRPLDGGVASLVDGKAVVAEVPAVDLENSASMLRTIFMAVKEGNWWLAAAGLLIVVVGLLRKFGKKVHAWLPDTNPLDKIFWFFFETKVGAWVMNWLTAVAGGVGTGLLAGMKVDFTLWKSVIMVSTSGTMLVELYDDVKEWWDARKAKQAAAAGVPGNPPAVK